MAFLHRDYTTALYYFDRALANVLPGIGKMKPADWDRIRTGYRFRGRLLRDWKNRDLLRAGMSAEELALVEDGSGYSDWIEGETGLGLLHLQLRFRTIQLGHQRFQQRIAVGRWMRLCFGRTPRCSRQRMRR